MRRQLVRNFRNRWNRSTATGRVQRTMPPPPPAAPLTPRRAAEWRRSERRRAPAVLADTPLVVVAGAVALGAGAAPLLTSAGVRPETLGVVSALVLARWRVAWRHEERLGAVWLVGAIALCAAGWSGASWRLFPEDDVGRFAREEAGPVCLEVVARGAPTFYPAAAPSPYRAIPSTERTLFAVEAVALRDATVWRGVSGRCEVSVAGRLASIRPGDRLRVFGQLHQPSPARNPGERDNATRERAERRLAVVWADSLECVEASGVPEPAPLARLVAAAQQGAIGAIDRRFTPEAAPLARAAALGDASGLEERSIDAFERTGTIHLLVVSGMNVALVAGLLPLLGALGLVPRRAAWLGAGVVTVAYVALVGGDPPALRAGVAMGAMATAGLAGRRALSVSSLAGAAVALFAWEPGAWLSPGTQLSFVSAATLLACGAAISHRHAVPKSPIDRLIAGARSPSERYRRGAARGVGLAVAASLLVQLVIGPLVASQFHLVSPAAAPLSLVGGPLLTAALVTGLGAALADAASDWAPLASPVADAFGWAGSWAATTLDGLVIGCAALPGAGFWTAGPPAWWPWLWIGWLGLATAAATSAPRFLPLTTRLGLVALGSAFAGPLLGAIAPSESLRCSFIAVGHGSAVLVEPPSGGALLVDAGALAEPERVSETIARALWARGVQRLDAVFITHADTDHYNALPGLLERMPVDVVFTTTRTFPAYLDPEDLSGPASLARRLAEEGVPVRTLVTGDRMALGGTTLEVLHPDDVGVADTDNANSLVLGIEYAGRRVLLPGDLEGEGVRRLLAQENYDCDVLLAPHHGSVRSDPAGFAGWCRPEVVVVSSGERRDAAGLSYTDTGAMVWSTHAAGMVTAEVSQRGIGVEVFRTGNPAKMFGRRD